MHVFLLLSNSSLSTYCVPGSMLDSENMEVMDSQVHEVYLINAEIK